MSATDKSTARGRAARMALPTNQTERLLDPRQPIVTKTDLKGKITYANPAFIEISGFTKDELMGQPHNIVRHPDMPKEAFEDLWNTTRADVPWRGRVKNRCKDGGYYWVDAYVTPLTENGQKIGYMSVRTAPTQQQKDDAQQLYQQVSQGTVKFPYTKLTQGRSIGVDIALSIGLIITLAVAQAFVSGPWVWVVLACEIAVAVASWFWLGYQIRTPLAQMNACMQALSEGNFKTEVNTQATREFSNSLISLKSMQVNLRAIVSDVVSAAGHVKEDANQLNSLATELMERSRQQSDGINGVAAALEELSVSVSEISEATGNSSRHAEQALSVVATGTDRMQQSMEATEQVVEVVNHAQQKIDQLHGAVGKISVVTQTITEIAEKTNLLALNAAIEAARAGESGRGFAVVADEVRKLAELTRHSTTEIASTVAGVQSGTQEALETMGRAVKEVRHGTSMIQSANESLGNISTASRGVAESAHDIASMLDQQSQASTEVANSMERMSALTESNVSSICEVERAAQKLNETSRELQALVVHFEKSM